ncbi:response regulator [Brevibacillus ginsengisoli]|uniref:response regulator n=1 Tax=Brevibacillus ginsengisoli TaxID=363854 RepID=UPI003CFA546D
MDNERFSVLLIEDDPMVQEVNRQFVERVEGFIVCGIAGNGREGLELLKELKPDLVIMDIFMPLLDGIETLHEIRSASYPVDVIIISAAKEMTTIQETLRNGAIDYIIKPFKFERMKQALEKYRHFRANFTEKRTVTQSELDHIIAGRRVSTDIEQDNLPKGLNSLTLKQVVYFMMEQQTALSADEVADQVGIARVTARRYLEFLEKTGKLTRDIQYGGIGRPVNRYRLSQR